MDCNVKSVEKMIDVEVEMTRDAVQECQRGSCLMEGTGGGDGDRTCLAWCYKCGR